MIAASAASAPSQAHADYWVGQKFYGECRFQNGWMVGSQSYFNMVGFTGELWDIGTVVAECADHTAGNPVPCYAGDADYRWLLNTGPTIYEATVDWINPATGEVHMYIYITPPGATDGTWSGGYLTGLQHVHLYASIWRSFAGNLELWKGSALPDLTNGNVNYSIAGAQYGVYLSDADARTDANRIGTITTNVDGWGWLEGLSAGTYYVKEVVPSPNYQLDPNVYTGVVAAGGTYQVNGCNPANPLSETPNCVTFGMLKTDAETNEAWARGDATIAGAEYTVDFYYETDVLAQSAPVRTWVLRADDEGLLLLDDAHKVSGDPFYMSEDGTPILPMGSISIRETKAPDGYLPNLEVQRYSTTGAVEASDEDEPIRGGFKLQKKDAELGASAQGDASFEGVRFALYNRSRAAVDGVEPGGKMMEFEIPSSGYYESEPDALLYGTYEIREISSVDGYSSRGYSKTFSIRDDGEIVDLTGDDAPVNDVWRGGLEIQKYDADTGKAAPQGDADFAGIEITVYNESAGSVDAGSGPVASGDPVLVASLDASGHYKSAADALPYGTYRAVETKGNAYYQADPDWEQTFTIRSDGEIAPLTSSERGPHNDMMRGGFEVQKYDAETGDSAPQGDADFAGVEMTVYNRTGGEIVVDGSTVENGDPAFTATLDASGRYRSANGLLPLGEYEMRETKGNDAYEANAGWSCRFEITKAGQIASVSSPDRSPHDEIARGGFEIQKWDAGLDRADPQGSADFAGVQITAYNESAADVMIEGKRYAPGDPVFTATLDADGHFRSAADLLPYGTYRLEETRGNQYYLANEDWSQTIQIRADGEIIDLTASDKGPHDEIVRGGFEVQKYDAETCEAYAQGDLDFAGVQITVYNRTGGDISVDGKQIRDGEAAFTATLDASGHYRSDAALLPLGDYELRETKGNAAYRVNEDWSHEFSIDSAGEIAAATSADDGVYDEVVRGGFEIQKWDAELDRTKPQGNADFAGVQVTVYSESAEDVVVEGERYAPGEAVFTATLDAAGHFESASDLLPYGTYRLEETRGNQYYQVNEGWSQTIQIRADGEIIDLTASDKGPHDEIVRGGFEIQKWDAELDRTEPQGDGNYAGVQISVYNRTGGDVYVDGNVIPDDGLAFTAVLDAAGHYESPNDLLPYGDYELRETKDSDNGAYYADEAWSQTIQIRTAGQMVDLTALDKGPNDQVLRGGLAVQKFASEVSDGTIDLSMNGTFPDIRLQSTLHLASLDAGVSSVLNAASAAAADGQRLIDMIIVVAGGTDAITADMFGMKNDENQTTASDPMATAQAGAMFAGAEITVVNDSIHSVNIDGKGVVEPGGIVAVLVLDENGYAATDARALPYGTYTLTETKAPEGYHLNTEWSKTVKIREEGVIVEVGDLPEAETGLSGIDDQVIRGDYAFIKTAEDTQDSLPFTPFLLVNLQSGENHVVVTNENGEFYTHSYTDEGAEYNLHSTNTNANDDAITWNEDGTYTIDDSKLDNFAGVWFTGYGPLNDPAGVLAQRVEPNDQLGALPYGDYALIELNGDANIGYENIARTFTVAREGFEIGGGTVDDEWIVVELKTTAHDAATGDNFGSIENDTTTIVDIVEFSPGLRADEEYTFTGVLMDKATNESVKDADGNEITASTTHVVTVDESVNGGIVEVEFADIPSELLRGKVTVVFEDVFHSETGVWVAGHADIDDEGQTVYYPEIHTTATDGITGDHQGNAPAGGTITINDEVAYAGLKPGETYTMTGTLYDKATGEAIEGVEPVSVEFTPETSDGTVSVVFEVPADLLRGKDTVVFENCYLGEREVAIHADIDDEGQTVEYPEIHTTATDGNDGDKTFSGQQTVTLIDTVEYSNLTPGVEYTMTGTLYDKATGEPVPGVAHVSQTFTPEAEDGTMEMTFTFDIIDLVGHDIVVFEDCYRDFDANGELTAIEKVAEHADINDEGQTVNVRDAGLADDLIADQPLSQTGVSSLTALLGMVAVVIASISATAAVSAVKRKRAR